MSHRFYITTAIDYVNGEPHVGHAYEKVVTDAIARGRRSLGEEVFFLTGLDEHGQKVQQTAQAAGKEPQAYCDDLAAVWKAFAARLNLSNDDFIRTTEDRHRIVVQAVLTKLHREDHLRVGLYEGWYSTKEETFLTDKDRLPDGSFPDTYGEVIKVSESNYFFKLSQHQPWLIEHIEQNPGFIYPDYRRNEILGFLKSEKLEDLCISRPQARLSWGIPLPFDPDYVTYVWFDALINYISVPAALGDSGVAAPLGLPSRPDAPSLWPAVHVIGKDIIKFHAVYWPILLKAVGIPIPRQILVHGWWQRDGQKLSKSTGNVVDPLAVIREWGLDAFRHYVISELDIGPDGNWSDSGFAARYQAELANELGNFVNRSISMLRRYRQGSVPALPESLPFDGTAERPRVEQTQSLQPFAEQAAAAVREAWGLSPKSALENIRRLVGDGNVFVDVRKPFKLAKSAAAAEQKELDDVLYSLVETCRILAVLLWPVIPDTASKIYAQLGLAGAPDRWETSRWGGLQPGHRVGEPQPLFPRKDLEKVQANVPPQ